MPNSKHKRKTNFDRYYEKEYAKLDWQGKLKMWYYGHIYYSIAIFLYKFFKIDLEK